MTTPKAFDTISNIKWDAEHKLFKGTYFTKWTFRRRKYTLGKGRMFGGGYAIGGQIDGEYQEIDVSSEEEINSIMKLIQKGCVLTEPCQKVFVIFYQPGYGDDPYIKGVFSSRKKALTALKQDLFYKRSKEGLDFEIKELDLNKLC